MAAVAGSSLDWQTTELRSAILVPMCRLDQEESGSESDRARAEVPSQPLESQLVMKLTGAAQWQQEHLSSDHL